MLNGVPPIPPLASAKDESFFLSEDVAHESDFGGTLSTTVFHSKCGLEQLLSLERDVGAFPLEIPRGGLPPACSALFLLRSASKIGSRCSMRSELRVAKVGTKGQVVIPNEFRTALKLEPGDAVIVQLEGSRVVFERRRTTILALVGKYAPHASVAVLQPAKEGDQHGA